MDKFVFAGMGVGFLLICAAGILVLFRSGRYRRAVGKPSGKIFVIAFGALLMLAVFTGLFVSGKALWVAPGTRNDVYDDDTAAIAGTNRDIYDAAAIAEIYRDIYDAAAEGDALEDLKTLRRIVQRFGEHGYAAVDSNNQIDLVCPEQIRQLCERVEAGEEAQATLFVIVSASHFVKYDFTANDGAVEVWRTCCQRRDRGWETVNVQSYPACTWVYTGKYLFFEEYHAPGFDGASGHTAVRLEPLDERCRELNRKYIRPVGYELNNLFTSDWSEDDFQELNFYDLYEKLYQMKTGQNAAEFLDEGVTHEIPGPEFEDVFLTFFRIDRQTLRRYTAYYEDAGTYQYRARGMYDYAPTPNIPYPEVVACEEHEEGTLTLTVNAVWPEENLERAFCHEVVIRPLENGGFRYVSNHVIPSKDNVKVTWYEKRLSDEKWREYYGESDTGARCAGAEKGYDLPVREGEREEAKADCKKMMGLVRDIYAQADKGDTLNPVLSDETTGAMQSKLKETKAPLITAGVYADMENYEGVDAFLKDCKKGGSGSVVVYELCSDGSLLRYKYFFDEMDMYVLAAKAVWRDGDRPVVSHLSNTRILQWDYTDRGWFCYELCVPEYPEVTEVVDGSRLIRVKPMENANRKMSERCVLPLTYKGNNLLRLNWDGTHLEELDYNGLYEHFYEMKYGVEFRPEDDKKGIPKEQFERLMTEYLPVTREEVERYAVFDADSRTYRWEGLGCSNYAPNAFGTSVPEVTQIRKNEDGTVTLTVDAVCAALCDEAVITHELTVRFSADGSFRYVSNQILGDGIRGLPDYQYRIDISR